VTVTIEPCSDEAAWDAYIHRHPDASGYHLWGWRRLFEGVFGHRAVYLAATTAGTIHGVLPLVAFHSLLFGRFMVSLPFVNYGGVVSDSDDVAAALVSEAGRRARATAARHIELRHTARRFPELAAKTHKVAMLLPLPASKEALWSALDRKVRNQVRKAEKSGLVAEVGGAALLNDFYDVFARNMRDLGTPVYSRRLFETVLATFPDRAQVVVVRLDSRAVAAAVTWRWRDRVEVPWASSLREFNSLAPNNLLYWTILQAAIDNGATSMDFGRSTPNEGTFHFKRQWGAEPMQLYWEYDLATAELPDQSPKNRRFALAVEVWRRLPVAVANTAGPWIVRSIP
jgi:FemAB-related protein (PEP-CTERM system-associated)